MKNLNYKIYSFLLILGIGLFLVTPSFAHVTVKPNEVGIGAFQTFTVGVPNEKDNPTIEMRLIIPNGLEHVSPNTKPGWNIEVSKAGDMKGKVLNNGKTLSDEEANEVVQIRWYGGSIPEGQRDDFVFSAKVPAKTGELIWSAYQTYSDGTTVAWDQDPTIESPEGSGPYSKTAIVDDLTPSQNENTEATHSTEDKPNIPLVLSIIAVLIASFSLGLQLKKK